MSKKAANSDRFEDLSEMEQFREGAALLFPNAENDDELADELEHHLSKHY